MSWGSLYAFYNKEDVKLKIRLANLNDVEALNVLHFNLNRHRHKLQPKNFQGKSMGEEWVKEKITEEKTNYIVLEVEGQIKGMALIEIVEIYSIPGILRYKYLQIEDFVFDTDLNLEKYGQLLFQEIRAYGKALRLNHIQLSELANDHKKMEFFYQQDLMPVQQLLKCVI